MDHVAGFDDVRRFNTINGTRVECDPNAPGANGRTFRIEGRPLPCYASPETQEAMHRIFPYVKMQGGEQGLFRPQIEFRDATAPFRAGSLKIESFRVEHGFPCCGYLFSEGEGDTLRRIGYASDCHDIPDESLALLRGVDAMVIDCLREREHPTHMSLARAMEYLERISPKKAYLTHMCHDLTHEDWLKRLPPWVEPAYDGLTIAN
jgi:phosphoribosyl 1,2-cyclic phosphate phosphodiesterase